MIVYLSILKSHNVDCSLYIIQDFIPFFFMFFHS